MQIVSEKGEVWKRGIRKGEELPRYVSSFGKVVDLVGNKLRWADNGAGYKNVSRGGGKREYVHRLVAETFIPNPNNLPQVNHIDCNKSNNRADNLEWISGKDNILDAHKKGRMVKRTSNGKINVLTKEQVIDLYTSVVRDCVGIAEKAREMNIPRTTASSIINKRSRSDITDWLDKEFSLANRRI